MTGGIGRWGGGGEGRKRDDFKDWYSGIPPYGHLVITTTFLCPERIESPVISLVLQPR